ncbi:MAG: hypothetical protein ABII74_08675 [Elusimicrobiota bacterium]
MIKKTIFILSSLLIIGSFFYLYKRTQEFKGNFRELVTGMLEKKITTRGDDRGCFHQFF